MTINEDLKIKLLLTMTTFVVGFASLTVAILTGV